jgi:predicted permease
MTGDNSWRRLRRVFRRDPAEEIGSELDHHVEERVRDYITRGMTPEEARRAALERVGDLDAVRSECVELLADERRNEERRIHLNVSWLDVKLGVRMLLKYPGLSAVSVIGMAVAIVIGAGSYALIDSLLDSTLPFEEGDRVVAIQNNRADNPGNPQRQALHDFLMWRDELVSVRELGAWRSDRRNLVREDGSTELVRVAEMSAAGFRVARVPALIGRTLVDSDERAGGPAVVVIGYDEWQRRFDGDPGVAGRTVRLGSAVHTIVGVMPEAFRFPVYDRFWIPLRMNPSDYSPGSGPAIEIFGRLADGVTLKQAQAELTTIGQRMAAQFPATHEHLRPRVMPYTHPYFDVDSPMVVLALHAFRVGISLLLVVIAVNVAILVHARTATRLAEITVRTALGASRQRVLLQLFVEGLVLSTVAAVVGLTVTAIALGRAEALLEVMGGGGNLPFWWSLEVSPDLVAYVAGLAVLGGAIVGVLPALKATGRRVHAGLQQLSSRGSRMQLGRTWTVLIVAQVAIAVAALPAAVFWAGAMVSFGAGDPGFAIDEFISASVSIEREEAPPSATAAEYERALAARFADRRVELLRRLNAEPGVDATFASTFPGRGELPARIEVEGVTTTQGPTPPRTVGGSSAGQAAEGATQASASFGVLFNHIGTDLFDMFDVPMLAGRAFNDADAREGATAVIINQTFANRIASGANVIGRRLRYVTRDGRPDPERDGWYEIVGVVPSFPAPLLGEPFNSAESKLYHPISPAQAQPGFPMLIARVRGASAAGFTRPLRDITASVDPALQLHELSTATAERRVTMQGLRMVAFGILIVTASVLLLSAAGIYAMMSFTVARRRREIGIRSALGADPRRVLSGIFARAGAQLAMGVAVGLILAIAFEWVTDGFIMGGRPLYVLPAVAGLIMTVGMLAALGPARRGLSVQPTEALREE